MQERSAAVALLQFHSRRDVTCSPGHEQTTWQSAVYSLAACSGSPAKTRTRRAAAAASAAIIGWETGVRFELKSGRRDQPYDIVITYKRWWWVNARSIGLQSKTVRWGHLVLLKQENSTQDLIILNYLFINWLDASNLLFGEFEVKNECEGPYPIH